MYLKAIGDAGGVQGCVLSRKGGGGATVCKTKTALLVGVWTKEGKISDSKLKEVKDVEDQDKKDRDDYIADKLEQGYSMDRIQEKLGERKPGRARKMGLAASRWITGSKSPFAARTIARGALKKKKHKHTKKNKPRKKPRTTKPRPRKTKKPKFRSRARKKR
jgi:hypothetical protein